MNNSNFALKTAINNKNFSYTFDFGNEHSTLFGFNGEHYLLQRVYDNNAEEDMSIHAFKTFEKLEAYMESWFGEGYLEYLSETYETEQNTEQER